MLQTQTTSRNKAWDLSLRNRVGDVVTHDEKNWINVNGKNGEPGNSFDWTFMSFATPVNGDVGDIPDVPKVVYIDGQQFIYKPIIGNSGETRQQGDLALDGWISQNNFGIRLIYSGVNGGTGETMADWTVDAEL